MSYGAWAKPHESSPHNIESVMVRLDHRWGSQWEVVLEAYDSQAVRTLATSLLQGRNAETVDVLRKRIADALANAPLVDRRLRELPVAGQHLLQVLAINGRPDWPLSALSAMAAAVAPSDDGNVLQVLIEHGFLLPAEQLSGRRRLSIPPSLAVIEQKDPRYFVPPLVLQRARLLETEWSQLTAHQPTRAVVRETDGLDIPLRMAVVWQLVRDSALRLTKRRDLNKRDLARLRSDPLLTAPFIESVSDPPDLSLLIVDWAIVCGLLIEQGSDLLPGTWSQAWGADLALLLAELWKALPDLERWCPDDGWHPSRDDPHPFVSVYPLVLALLAKQPPEAWLHVAEIAAWLAQRHPHWQRPELGQQWIGAVVWGLMFPLRLVHAAPGEDGEWLVRLSSLGRWLIGDRRDLPTTPAPPQTLLVQPNYEILLLRHGLTPTLITEMSRLARWQSLGAACMLRLDADSVYHGLESGMESEAILRFLTRHSMRELPDNVVAAVRTWSNKRERIVVYHDCIVVECATPDDLDEALRRGLIDLKLGDRFGLTRHEDQIDYRQIRLIGRRDFQAAPERCLTVSDDGLEFQVDPARSDLLVELDLQRIAEPVDTRGNGRRYRLTRPLLQRTLTSDWSLAEIDRWLQLRAGAPLSPAARLLALPDHAASFQLRSCWVLFAPDELVADGIMQWPVTRGLIRERLGPTALVLAAEDVPRVRQILEELGQPIPMESLKEPHEPG